MHSNILLGLVGASLCVAHPQFPVPKSDGTFGGGKYPAFYSTEPSLKGYTIYAPKTNPTEKLPVILWGNGMCMDQGLGFRNFLTEVASHGYFIIANGEPEGKGQSADTKLGVALNWVAQNAGSGKYAHVDKDSVAAAGQSCGGLQALKVGADKRVKLVGVFDSGNLMGGASPVLKVAGQVGYFIGGTSDLAAKPSKADWGVVKIPAMYVDNPSGGHMQSFFEKQGGLVAQAGTAFFEWKLKNSTAGKDYFVQKSGAIFKSKWTVEFKNGFETK